MFTLRLKRILERRRRIAVMVLMALLTIKHSSETPLHTQANQGRLPALVDIYTSRVTLGISSDLQVSAELYDRQGIKGAQSVRAGVLSGEVSFVFEGRSGRSPIILPEDYLLVTAEGSEPHRIDVPQLYVDMDPQLRTVYGQIAPNSSITLSLVFRYEDGSSSEQKLIRAEADKAGSFAMDIGHLSGRAISASGMAIMLDSEGIQFRTSFASPITVIETLANRLSGIASLGTQLHFEISSPSGLVYRSTLNVLTRPTWNLSLTNALMLQSEATMTVTVGAMGQPTNRVSVVKLAALSLGVNRTQRTISGQGPAGSHVQVEVFSSARPLLSPPDYQKSVIIDGAGSYALTVDESVVQFTPGTKISSTIELAPGVKQRVTDVLKVIDISLLGGTIAGDLGRPNTVITVTLTTGDGREVMQGATITASNGRFSVGGDGVSAGSWRFVPGDTVEIVLSEGDPQSYRIPRLTAFADEVNDRIVGEAPLGTSVTIWVPSYSNSHEVNADPNGQYSFAFSTSQPLLPAMSGYVMVANETGWRTFLPWAPLTVQHRLGSDLFEGRVADGRSIHLRLFGSDGSLRGEGETRVQANTISERGSFYSERWAISPLDSAGQALLPKSGDRIEIVTEDGETSVVVPPLSGSLSLVKRRLEGLSVPNSVLEGLLSLKSSSMKLSLHCDDAGRFSYVIPESTQLEFNDEAYLSITLSGGHRFSAELPAGGLALNLSTGTLNVVTVPLARCEIFVMRGNIERRIGEGFASPEGRLSKVIDETVTGELGPFRVSTSRIHDVRGGTKAVM